MLLPTLQRHSAPLSTPRLLQALHAAAGSDHSEPVTLMNVDGLASLFAHFTGKGVRAWRSPSCERFLRSERGWNFSCFYPTHFSGDPRAVPVHLRAKRHCNVAAAAQRAGRQLGTGGGHGSCRASCLSNIESFITASPGQPVADDCLLAVLMLPRNRVCWTKFPFTRDGVKHAILLFCTHLFDAVDAVPVQPELQPTPSFRQRVRLAPGGG